MLQRTPCLRQARTIRMVACAHRRPGPPRAAPPRVPATDQMAHGVPQWQYQIRPLRSQPRTVRSTASFVMSKISPLAISRGTATFRPD